MNIEELKKEYKELMETKLLLIDILSEAKEGDKRYLEYYQRFIDLRTTFEQKVHNLTKDMTHRQKQILINKIQEGGLQNDNI